jgi:tetrahydromethanopterin S-methyltransferase subunit G
LTEVRITSEDIRHANRIIKEKGYNLNWPGIETSDIRNLKRLNRKMTVWEESYYKAGLRDGDGVGFIKGFIIGIAAMLFLMITKVLVL